MRLNIGHSQCTANDNVDGDFFLFFLASKLVEEVYLCLKSTINCKSIYKNPTT